MCYPNRAPESDHVEDGGLPFGLKGVRLIPYLLLLVDRCPGEKLQLQQHTTKELSLILATSLKSGLTYILMWFLLARRGGTLFLLDRAFLSHRPCEFKARESQTSSRSGPSFSRQPPSFWYLEFVVVTTNCLAIAFRTVCCT